MPWQICALAVDEIEALAPKRETDGNNSGERLSVLLSVITGGWKNLQGILAWSHTYNFLICVLLQHCLGGKDVENLILIGCTNLRTSMDAAFLRRMNLKFFVGKPDFEGRR